jgi:hypothetical protein
MGFAKAMSTSVWGAELNPAKMVRRFGMMNKLLAMRTDLIVQSMEIPYDAMVAFKSTVEQIRVNYRSRIGYLGSVRPGDKKTTLYNLLNAGYYGVQFTLMTILNSLNDDLDQSLELCSFNRVGQWCYEGLVQDFLPEQASCDGTMIASEVILSCESPGPLPQPIRYVEQISKTSDSKRVDGFFRASFTGLMTDQQLVGGRGPVYVPKDRPAAIFSVRYLVDPPGAGRLMSGTLSNFGQPSAILEDTIFDNAELVQGNPPLYVDLQTFNTLGWGVVSMPEFYTQTNNRSLEWVGALDIVSPGYYTAKFEPYGNEKGFVTVDDLFG